MGVLIKATTSAETSNPFVVQRGERVGVTAFGLAGNETAKLQRDNGNGQFADVIDNGTMTATDYQVTIVASGTYRAVKSSTASPAGVSYD